MGFIAIIMKWERLCQWVFSPSHSSYDKGDNLFFLSIRTSLLLGLCQTISLSLFPCLPSLPVPCALLSSNSGCQAAALKASAMAFVLIPGNAYHRNEMTVSATLVDLSLHQDSQHFNWVTSSADVRRSAYSLAAAQSCHLWLTFPAVLCPLPRWTAISGNVTSSSRAIMDITYQCQEWMIQ